MRPTAFGVLFFSIFIAGYIVYLYVTEEIARQWPMMALGIITLAPIIMLDLIYIKPTKNRQRLFALSAAVTGLCWIISLTWVA